MIKHLRFLIVLLMTLVWSTGWAAEAKTVVCTLAQKSSGCTSDVSGIVSWSYTDANSTDANKRGIQWYTPKNVKLTANFSSTVKITKVVINANTNASTGSTIELKVGLTTYGKEKITKGATSATGNSDYTFTGTETNNAMTLILNSSKSLYVNKVTITYEEDTKTPTSLSFPKASFSFATTDDLKTFTGQTATLTADGTALTGKTITYSKSGDEIFSSFDTANGTFVLNGNAGTATVTATFAGDDTYASASAEYTLNVVDPNKTDVTFDFTDPSNFGYTESSSVKIVLNEGDKLTKDGFVLENVQAGKYTTRLHEGYLKIYASDKNHPAKGKISLSAPAGCVINRIVFTDNGDSPVSNLTFSIGEIDSNSKTWTGSAKALTMEVAQAQVFIQKMTIYFVKDTETITLDETATNNTIVAKAGVNVTLNRTMAKGVWNTICLPFGLTSEQITTVFGVGVKVAQLDDTNSTGATLKFVDMTNTGMEASVPYLIKPVTDAPADGYKFVGVEITEDAVIPTKVKTAGNLYFNGVYNMVDATTEVASGYNAAFLGKGNTVFGAQSNTKMKGFRAYFAIPTGVKASELRVVIDGTATSIKNIDSEVVESNAPVYNLQGQRVDGNNLTPGIYVKAGKKFVVK